MTIRELRHWRSQQLSERRQTWRYVATAVLSGILVAGWFLRNSAIWTVTLAIAFYWFFWNDYTLGRAIENIDRGYRDLLEEKDTGRREFLQSSLDWRVRRTWYQILRG